MADSKESRGASQNKRRLAGRKSSGIRGGPTAVVVGGLAILACAEVVRWIVKRRRAAKQITRNSEQVESKSTTVDESCCSPSSDVAKVVVSANGSPDLGFEGNCKDQSSNAGISSGNGALEDTSDAGKFVSSKELGTPDAGKYVVSKELGTPDAAKVVELASDQNGKDHNSSDETNVDNGVSEGMEGSTCGHEQEEEEEGIVIPPQDDHARVSDEHDQVGHNALLPRASSIQTEFILENKELTPLLEMSQIAQEMASLDASSIEALEGLRESIAVYVDKELVNDLTQEASIKQVISCCMKDSVKKQVELWDFVVNYGDNEVREQKTCEEPAEGVAAAVLMNKPEAADNLVDKVDELKTREELDPKVTTAVVINKAKAADGLQVLTLLHADIIQLSTDHKSKSTSETVECSTDESKQASSVEQPLEHAQPIPEITFVPNDLSVDRVKPAEGKLEPLANPQELAATPAQDLKKVMKPFEILKKSEGKGVRHRPWIEDLWQMVPVAMEIAIMLLFIGFILMLLKHLSGLSQTGYPSD